VKRALFICVENSNRSQMAEAFAHMHGKGVLEPFSAGSRPSGVVNPRAVHAMEELGYDLSMHRSQSVDELPAGPFDYVITLGCGDECPWIEAVERDDWPVPDPRAMPPEEFNQVRDEIERRVTSLIEKAGSSRD
jgi:arsenate reductase (thioredoxin)